jgi:lipopolysaccharide export system permease protein
LRLLDRYIFKSALFTSLAAIGVFAFVLMAGNVIRDLIGPGLAGQLSLGAAGRLVFLLVPFVISYALPMGLLTGVLLTLGRLSAESEITAMRAHGISPLRIAIPIVALGALGAAAGLPINFEYMPRARVQYDRELTDAVRANPLSFIVPRTFIRDFPGYVLYVGEKQGVQLRDFWLWQLDEDHRVIRFVRAASGKIEYDEPRNDFILTLTEVKVETRNARNPEDFSEADPVGTFEKSDPVRLPLDRIFGRTGQRLKLAWMTYSELRAEKARLAGEKAPPGRDGEQASAKMRVAITIQNKFNTAFAALTFAFIGVPLGIKVSRRETSANLGVAVLLALGYYFLTVTIGWLDRHPEYRPDLLLWLPNLALIGIGVRLFGRIGKK